MSPEDSHKVLSPRENFWLQWRLAFESANYAEDEFTAGRIDSSSIETALSARENFQKLCSDLGETMVKEMLQSCGPSLCANVGTMLDIEDPMEFMLSIYTQGGG